MLASLGQLSRVGWAGLGSDTQLRLPLLAHAHAHALQMHGGVLA